MSSHIFFNNLENTQKLKEEISSKTSFNNYVTAISQNFTKKNQIIGFIPIKLNENEKEYIFDSFSENITDLSNEVYYYYKSKRNCICNKNKGKELKEMFLENLSSCHQISLINSKLISKDPLDKLLYKFTNWEIYNQTISEDNVAQNLNDTIANFIRPNQEKDINEKIELINHKYNTLNEKILDETHENLLKEHYELGIIRNFGCDDNSYKKTVIIKDINDDFFKVFSKGNPSVIQDICKPDTIPINFKEKVNEFLNKGKIIIALCGKMIKMNYLQSQLIERAKCERNMIFLGLVVIERNKRNSSEFL